MICFVFSFGFLPHTSGILVPAYTLKNMVRLLFERVETIDHRNGRFLGIIQGITTKLGSRVVGVLVSFLSVPLTIGYLGPERYGAWLTIGSLLAWLGLTDFGLGNGLLNAVSSAVGQERHGMVRTHVTNGMLLLFSLALLVGVMAFFVWPYMHWESLFGLSSRKGRAEIGPAIMVALGIFLIQFPLAVTSKIYLAYREGRIENYWGMAANILSLFALIAVTHTHGGLVWLVAAVSGTSMLVNLASTGWLFWWHKPFLRPGIDAISASAMQSLLDVGGKFFLIQVMALVVFETDNVVIGHYTGAAHVPEYNLTYRLFEYALLPQTLLFPYLWTAYNEAIARKDILWVTQTFHLTLYAGMGFTLVAAFFLICIAKPFIGWWAGATVEPNLSLIAWMAIWSLINAFTSPIACLLAASSNLRNQTIYSAISTISNIFLSISWVQRYGIDGVIAATVISYVLIICIPSYIDTQLLLKRLRHAV